MSLTRADVVERIVALFVLLVHEARVALREGAAGRVLTGQTHRVALGQERAKGQCLAGGPVKAFAGVEHLLLGLQETANSFVQRITFGSLAQ